MSDKVEAHALACRSDKECWLGAFIELFLLYLTTVFTVCLKTDFHVTLLSSPIKSAGKCQ